MKATFEFNLPEEQSEFDIFCNAQNMCSAIGELDTELRAAVKYGSCPEWDTETTMVIRDKLHQILKDNDVETLF